MFLFGDWVAVMTDKMSASTGHHTSALLVDVQARMRADLGYGSDVSNSEPVNEDSEAEDDCLSLYHWVSPKYKRRA